MRLGSFTDCAGAAFPLCFYSCEERKFHQPMPLKSGALTHQERIFAKHYAATGDGAYAATKAGYAQPAKRASENLAKPAVQDEAMAQSRAILMDRLLPASMVAAERILTAARNEGAQVSMIKAVWDYAGVKASDAETAQHEMSSGQLNALLNRLAEERSLIIDGEVTDVEEVVDEPIAQEAPDILS